MRNNENQNENQNMSEEKKITLQEILNGNFLTRDWFRKQYGICILIVSLIFLYIFFGFQAQRQQRQLTYLQKQLQETHYEQLTIEAELTERTRQSAIMNKLHEQGSELQENLKPVIRIQ